MTNCQKAEDRAPSAAQIVIPVAERLGNVVIEAEGLSKGFGDKLLIEDLNFKLPPGGIVGIIGPNGAGKTTLFRMITGQEQPDSGSITIGETVQSWAMSTRAVTALDPKQDRLGGDLRRQRHHQARQTRSTRAPIAQASTSRAATSSRRSERSQAVSATACIWPRC
jgi:ATPase subunit of ABC transporter with duplicated ATPase domains